MAADVVHFFQRGCCTQPQMLDYEGGKHIAPHTYIGAITYAVHFFLASLLCTPQMLDYEGGKHKAPTYVIRITYTAATTSTIHFFQRGYCAHPHTYITGATYAVPFFQRGCCTQPHMLDYEGGKHIAPTHSWCNSLCCTFLPTRLLNTPTASELRRQEKHSPPTHLLLKQPTLYISSSEATQHTPQILNYEGRKHTAPTHILLKQPTLYISSSEATQHIHRFWITKAGNTQPPTHLLLKQPTLYISSSEATQHIHRF